LKSFLFFVAFITYVLLSYSTSFSHHEEEVYMFLYFAQEPGVLKISTFILGSFLILCGIYISYKASLEVKKNKKSKKKMFGPGVVTVVIGMIMILSSIFILSENPRIKYEQKNPISAPSKIKKIH
jgi:H+/Cl- antiporter ClcA